MPGLVNERRPGWRPMLLAGLSAGLHAGAAVAIVVDPLLWPWAAGSLIGNHMLLGAVTLWPRGQWLGPNIVHAAAAARRAEVCLTFDDGPHPDITPRVLDLLDRHSARASFFCIGERAAAHPELVRDIVRRGHSVENHSFRHTHTFALLGRSRLRREVEQAQSTLAGVDGRAPRYFRAPAGFRSLLLDRVLARQGLAYVSWTRRGYDGVLRNPQWILRLLLRGMAPGDVLLLHDSRDTVLSVLPLLLEALDERGLRCVTLRDGCAD